jgi:MFS family permease
LIAGVTISSLFGLMVALGQNLATVLIGRFLAGLFGVAPIAVLGGIITDCWNAVYRGVAMAFCICLVFSGPTFGPVIGGFIVESSIGWRWTMWVVIIAGLAVCLLALITYPETHPPSLLCKRAKRLRKETGNRNVRSSLEVEGSSIGLLVRVYLMRPWSKWHVFCDMGFG